MPISRAIAGIAATESIHCQTWASLVRLAMMALIRKARNWPPTFIKLADAIGRKRSMLTCAVLPCCTSLRPRSSFMNGNAPA